MPNSLAIVSTVNFLLHRTSFTIEKVPYNVNHALELRLTVISYYLLIPKPSTCHYFLLVTRVSFQAVRLPLISCPLRMTSASDVIAKYLNTAAVKAFRLHPLIQLTSNAQFAEDVGEA